MKRLITMAQALSGWHKQRDLQVPRLVLVYPHERAKWDAMDAYRADLRMETNPAGTNLDAIAGIPIAMTHDQPRYPKKTRT